MKKDTFFTRPTDDSLIVVPCSIDSNPLALALDTGASHTTVDLTPMLMAGYEMSHALRTEKIETASGVIDSHVFMVKSFTALGVTKKDIIVCAYDFFAYHYLTDFDGVLGLDFFEDLKFCINLKKGEISTEKI
jgi:hypothetical protein